ncbi:hypothetical protein [Ekhidna sp.]|uniref:hypothetical protein n=1 Tax=Ekhidna sp. TaxID=2608089 RepID=UPI003CCB9D61
MNVFLRMTCAMLSLCLLIFLNSCSKTEVPTPELDFTIESTPGFEVESTYENGWIKEAYQYDDNIGVKMAEFEYHENGYIKHCKSYTFSNGQYSVASHYLAMEVTRDESNLPIQSIYYNPDDSKRAEIIYEKGLITEKKIYDDDQTIICSYENGRIETVTSNLNEGVVQITYHHFNETKTISITKEGESIFEADIPIFSKVGEGLSKIDHHPRANRLSEETTTENILNSTFSSSITYKSVFEPYRIMPVPIIYGQSSFSDLLDGYFSRDFDLFRMIVEEFPYFEDGFLHSGFNILSDEITIIPSIATSEAVKVEMNEDVTSFQLKYGDEFLRKRIFGKYGFTIGTLRNLPSDPSLREQLKDLANKKTNYILNNSEALTIEEETLLSNIFFELKMHSPVLGIHGMVLSSQSDYLSAISQIENNDNYVIQKIFKGYDLL